MSFIQKIINEESVFPTKYGKYSIFKSPLHNMVGSLSSYKYGKSVLPTKYGKEYVFPTKYGKEYVFPTKYGKESVFLTKYGKESCWVCHPCKIW